MKQINIEELLKTIGLNLRVIRTARDETLEGVAAALNTTHSTISHIENGNSKSLKLEQLVTLCNYYGVTLQQVMALEIVQFFEFKQNDNTNALMNANSQGPINELADGYKLFIEHLKEEIAELKKQAGK